MGIRLCLIILGDDSRDLGPLANSHTISGDCQVVPTNFTLLEDLNLHEKEFANCRIFCKLDNDKVGLWHLAIMGAIVRHGLPTVAGHHIRRYRCRASKNTHQSSPLVVTSNNDHGANIVCIVKLDDYFITLLRGFYCDWLF